MAITTKTATHRNHTVEISYGTAQEVADRIAAVLPTRQWEISFWIRGFTSEGQGSYTVLMEYITTTAV